MNREAADLWTRAGQALTTARTLVHDDPDAAASRAYYAAFYAVSSYFTLQGKSFSKHSGLESAVHRDLVKEGLWPAELGATYSSLINVRTTGDYGGGTHVDEGDAAHACDAAESIILAVRELCPALPCHPK